MCQELWYRCTQCSEKTLAFPLRVIPCDEKCHRIQDDPTYLDHLCEECRPEHVDTPLLRQPLSKSPPLPAIPSNLAPAPSVPSVLPSAPERLNDRLEPVSLDLSLLQPLHSTTVAPGPELYGNESAKLAAAMQRTGDLAARICSRAFPRQQLASAPVVALELDPNLSTSNRALLEQLLQQPLRPIRPAYPPSLLESEEAFEDEPERVKSLKAQLIGAELAGVKLSKTELDEAGVAKAEFLRAELAREAQARAGLIRIRRILADFLMTEPMRQPQRELDNLLRQICPPAPRMEQLPCDPDYRSLYRRSKQPHPCAATLAKYGLCEPEEWEYWRAQPSIRYLPHASPKRHRLSMATTQVSAADWPLPLPFEHLDDYLARRDVSLGATGKEVLTQTFQWRETYDPGFKAPSRKRPAVGKQAGPTTGHPEPGPSEDADEQRLAGHFGCFEGKE